MTTLRHDISLDMIRMCDKIYTEQKSADIIINNDKQYISVVFRGSKEFVDWRRNLYFHKHTIKNDIAVHYGFCKQLFADNLFVILRERLWTLIDQYPSYQLFVTGHSCGGAFATLFGYLISSELTNKHIHIVSFASPRIGNLAFQRDFYDKTNLYHWRFTNQHDCIPKIPYFGFHHVGEQVYLKKISLLVVIQNTAIIYPIPITRVYWIRIGNSTLRPCYVSMFLIYHFVKGYDRICWFLFYKKECIWNWQYL